MLPLDDPRWNDLQGGYRIPYDPTSALRRLDAGEDQQASWAELWAELHQGDVGEASYASVPHLVRILERGDLDWNGYALIATIDIERRSRPNPPIPDWLAPSYHAAWQEVTGVALRD